MSRSRRARGKCGASGRKLIGRLALGDSDVRNVTTARGSEWQRMGNL